MYHCLSDSLEAAANPILAYTAFDFEQHDPTLIENVQSIFPFVKFFPKHFIWVLINKGADDLDEFLTIFGCEAEYNTPELIWNAEMRDQLLNRVKKAMFNYRSKIENWIRLKGYFRGKPAPVLDI